MSCELAIGRSAIKELGALPADMRRRISVIIDGPGTDPRPPGCRKLVGGGDLWRVRVGDYRVVYSIDDTGRLVRIIAVRHRSRAYT